MNLYGIPLKSIFLDWRLIACFLLTAIINTIFAFAVTLRIAGVETRRLATSLTLFNLLALISRLANLIQSPILGSLVDLASLSGQLLRLKLQLHIVILGATLGNFLGILLLNTTKETFIKAIHGFERVRSMPKLLLIALFTKNGIRGFLTSIRMPKLWWNKDRALALLKPFVFYNVLVTAFWTSGVLSAMLASAMLPKYARTATLLSGVVNGVATVLFTLAVDPQVSFITDQIIEGERPKEDIYVLVTLISVGNLIGTLLSQVILQPGALLIAFITKTIASL